MFWRAPELLDKEWSKKSKEGDVYSYGIIVSEIMSREDPYGSSGLDAKGNLLHIYIYFVEFFGFLGPEDWGS